MKVLTLLIYFFFFLIHIENSLASDIIVNNYTINTKVSFSSKSVQVNLVCNLRKNNNSQDIQFLLNSLLYNLKIVLGMKREQLCLASMAKILCYYPLEIIQKAIGHMKLNLNTHLQLKI